MAHRLTTAERAFRHVPECIANREQCVTARKHRLIDITQRTVVIENVEAATKRCTNQIVLSFLNHKITERDVRRATFEPGPGVTTVHSEVHTKFGAKEHQSRLNVILYDTPQHVTFRQIAGDTAPAAPTVVALQDVRRKIAALVIVDHDVNRVRVMQVGLDVVDEKAIRYARKIIDRGPCLATIFGNLNQAIIRACVDQPCNQRRLGQRRNGVVLRHRVEVARCVVAPGPAHNRLADTIFIACQVTTNRRP